LVPVTTRAIAQEASLVKELTALSDVVLMCWEHKRIISPYPSRVCGCVGAAGAAFEMEPEAVGRFQDGPSITTVMDSSGTPEIGVGFPTAAHSLGALTCASDFVVASMA
jgi:hypothetical protein